MRQKLINTKHSNLAEHYLDIVCQRLPVVNRIIDQYGNMSLTEYVQQLVPQVVASYQKRDDLLDIIYKYVTPLLGESVALRAIQDFIDFPGVLTANHHGVEFFSQTFQARLILSLRALRKSRTPTTSLIFACGNIPLDNLTYPQGILMYHVNSSDIENVPTKLPIFSNKLRKWMVSTAPSFNKRMLVTAKNRVNKMLSNEKISSRLANTLCKIFQEDYEDPSVLKCSNYSQQSVVLNNRIWKRLFSKIVPLPDLVYLEIEKIVNELLRIDLLNSQSLVWKVLFDPNLREHLLNELDGARACWQRQKLAQMLMNSDGEKPKGVSEGCGTIFFWGVDHRMRRIPLSLETKNSGEYILRGITDRGHLWEIPYTPETIMYWLRENKLLPSLFTCFLVLSFARGIVCIGGYFQCEYLPIMQQGIMAALLKTPGYEDIAHIISQIPTNCYLDAMSTVMTSIQSKYLLPVGPLEIIAEGGLTTEDIDKIASLTIREAHLAGMFEAVPDAIPSTLLPSGWKKQLATTYSHILEGKIVVK